MTVDVEFSETVPVDIEPELDEVDVPDEDREPELELNVQGVMVTSSD